MQYSDEKDQRIKELENENRKLQENDFKRMGAELKRDMMANWMIRSSEYWLKPLYDEMHKQLLKCSIIMSDKTTWQVNHENGKKASSKSFIWIHRNGDYEGPPIILYEYTSTRSGNDAKKFLEGFQGYHVMPMLDMKRWKKLYVAFVSAI